MFGQNQSGGFRIPPTLIIAVVMAGFALCKYYGQSSVNDITGQTQHISMTPEQEVAMGLQSAPEMAQEMGGLSTNRQANGSRIGKACAMPQSYAPLFGRLA